MSRADVVDKLFCAKVGIDLSWSAKRIRSSELVLMFVWIAGFHEIGISPQMIGVFEDIYWNVQSDVKSINADCIADGYWAEIGVKYCGLFITQTNWIVLFSLRLEINGVESRVIS